MAYSPETLQDAHRFSSHHRDSLESSDLCGCFHCATTFRSVEIEEWTDGDSTALCPYCGIDAVLGDIDVPDLSVDFLTAMREYWY